MSDRFITNFDILAWQAEQKQWDNKESPKNADSNTIITIETNMIQNITVPVSTILTKPSLLNQDIYEFEKIEVGTSKRGKITIHNPSPNPLEVSFFIAPSNYVQNIINQILSPHNLPQWKKLCDSLTFFDAYGRLMCENLLNLNSLNEKSRMTTIDYFIMNYFNFIIMGSADNSELKPFISEQYQFLNQQVRNITDASNAVKPPVKNELEEEGVFEIFTNFLSRLSKKLKGANYDDAFNHGEIDEHTTDAYYEIVGDIRVRINNYLDQVSPTIKEEFKNMLGIFKNNFYIEHTSNCKRDQYGLQQEDDADCKLE